VSLSGAARLYETHLVPLLFEPYAADLVSRLSVRAPGRVLEIAAGTGVVTRRLCSMPESVAIVATDLSQANLDEAAAIGTQRRVEWRQADALQLPFADESFDAVVCQFGVMFFADKAKAFSEARRVLRQGGTFLFSVWDRLEENEFADTVASALASFFAQDPPGPRSRAPYSYCDRVTIERDLAGAGFEKPARVTPVVLRSRARSPRAVAVAYCHVTLLRNEIEARDSSRLGEATDFVEEALARRFGRGAVDGKLQALVVSVER
jgi:SAM-dependent methyltransferase